MNHLFDSGCASAVMLVMFAVANMGRIPIRLEEFLAVRITVRNLVFGILFLLLWQCCFALCGLYRTDLRERLGKSALRIVLACTVATSLISLFTLASRSGSFTLGVVASFWVTVTVAEIVGRSGIATIGRYVEKGTQGTKQAVIVGSGPLAIRLLHAIRSAQPHTSVVGFVDTVDGRDVPAEIQDGLVSSLDGLETLLSTRHIDQVLMAMPIKSCYAAMQQAIHTCEQVGVEVKYSPDVFSVSVARRAYHSDGEMPEVRLHLVADDHRLLVKRAIDVIVAATALIALAPLFGACALAIKLTTPGPILFTQSRFGYKRRLFQMYKFRTMVQDAEQLQGTLEDQNEALGPIFKIRADPRVTPVGRILRKSSLDELPQLVNVLRGHMSLVGPRPMSMRDVSRFSESWLLRRFSVKPGLTCLWQVSGRSNVGFDRWVELDLAYIDNWSLTLDMKILLKTVPAVLSGSGAM